MKVGRNRQLKKKKEVQLTLSYLTADYPTALRPTVCLLVCASVIRLFDFMAAPWLPDYSPDASLTDYTRLHIHKYWDTWLTILFPAVLMPAWLLTVTTCLSTWLHALLQTDWHSNCLTNWLSYYLTVWINSQDQDIVPNSIVFFLYFFGGQEYVGSFLYFVFLRDFWVRVHRAGVTSRPATNTVVGGPPIWLSGYTWVPVLRRVHFTYSNFAWGLHGDVDVRYFGSLLVLELHWRGCG